MITIKNAHARAKMADAGQRLAQLFVLLHDWLEPGMSTFAIDASIEKYLIQSKLVSSMKGYLGKYHHVSCISVNDEVVHGIPSKEKLIAEGDIVKIDVCASYEGYCADMARCFFIPPTKLHTLAFIATADAALEMGIEQAQPGKHLSDISAAIQQEVESKGYGVVREFAGHGIGKKMHEDPEILNYGKPGKGPVIRPGMAFAIEPMITMGDYKILIDQDGWTVRTQDKSLAAHVEDTIIVTENGPEIITRIA